MLSKNDANEEKLKGIFDGFSDEEKGGVIRRYVEEVTGKKQKWVFDFDGTVTTDMPTQMILGAYQTVDPKATVHSRIDNEIYYNVFRGEEVRQKKDEDLDSFNKRKTDLLEKHKIFKEELKKLTKDVGIALTPDFMRGLSPDGIKILTNNWDFWVEEVLKEKGFDVSDLTVLGMPFSLVLQDKMSDMFAVLPQNQTFEENLRTYRGAILSDYWNQPSFTLYQALKFVHLGFYDKNGHIRLEGSPVKVYDLNNKTIDLSNFAFVDDSKQNVAGLLKYGTVGMLCPTTGFSPASAWGVMRDGLYMMPKNYNLGDNVQLADCKVPFNLDVMQEVIKEIKPEKVGGKPDTKLQQYTIRYGGNKHEAVGFLSNLGLQKINADGAVLKVSMPEIALPESLAVQSDRTVWKEKRVTIYGEYASLNEVADVLRLGGIQCDQNSGALTITMPRNEDGFLKSTRVKILNLDEFTNLMMAKETLSKCGIDSNIRFDETKGECTLYFVFPEQKQTIAEETKKNNEKPPVVLSNIVLDVPEEEKGNNNKTIAEETKENNEQPPVALEQKIVESLALPKKQDVTASIPQDGNKLNISSVFQHSSKTTSMSNNMLGGGGMINPQSLPGDSHDRALNLEIARNVNDKSSVVNSKKSWCPCW